MKATKGPGVRQMLGRIYTEHRQGLFTLALSITRRPDTAEEAVQEAFARLCRSIETPSGDAVAYVFAAVRNAALDQLRRRATQLGQAVSIFDDTSVESRRPEQSLMDGERDRLLRQALEALPEEQRQVIVMKLFGELTFEQIAEALGEPLSTVSSRYRRTLEKLKTSVESLV